MFSADLEPPKTIDLRTLADSAFPRTGKDVRCADADGSAMDSDDWNTPSFKEVWHLQTAGVSPALYGWYVSQCFIGYQMCAILAQHWLIDRACTMPARDATRVGYTVLADGGQTLLPEHIEYIKQLDKRFSVRVNAREFIRNCRTFGIRIALFVVDSADPEYYEKPFNPDGVQPGSYRGISQVDPYWITPELDTEAASNPASIHFYEPTYWRISGKRYHRSHLVIIKTCEVPDVLKPTYYYGGVPLPQQIYERVYAAERTANEAPQLALTKRLNVIEGVNMEALAGDSDRAEENMERAASWRNNYGYQFLGGDEKLVQHDTSLADFDTIVMGQYTIVAAIAGPIPVTKLMGTSPKGMDATGESEETNYHELLESILEHDVRPLLERHHLLCMRSYVAPKFGIAPVALQLEFEKLDAETAEEASNRRKVDADRDKALAETGAIDGIDIRNRLIKDPDSGYTGIEAAEPEGPRPASVVDPGAEKTAPNAPLPTEQQPPGGEVK
jgi:phage-related protein (TIGR01555 family)